ncbi:MAG TPA: hypothetical protein VNM45_04955 [Bacillus sp. (in: firmicutes)]|nr:hypothetical protein [Bacillus sp. (in: firmicutes)]
MVLESAKRMAKDLYPVVVAKREEIFEDSVTVSALKKYFNDDNAVSLYVGMAIIYRLEAEGYVSRPLAELEYRRKLLK